MGAALKRPFYMTGSMLVRRVVRMGPKFVCGICRTHHKEPYTANDCLHSCWHEVRSSAAYVPVRRMSNTQYACIYCLRSYQTPNHAMSCAADCTQIMGLTEYNTSVDGRPRKRGTDSFGKIIPIAKAKVKPVPALPAPMIATPPPKKVEPQPVPTPVQTAPAPLASAAAAEAPLEIAHVEVKRKNGRVKKFERSGSKYVCEVCNEKFFTKAEVEACFEAHPD